MKLKFLLIVQRGSVGGKIYRQKSAHGITRITIVRF